MNDITIKYKERAWENKFWLKVYNCFDSIFFGKKAKGQKTGDFSLKEMSIEPNMGFMPHTHKNKDFIIIPTQGSLIQKNNQGQSFLAKKGDIQILSTGAGITHFEYNESSTEKLNCIVFEIIPDVLDKKPQCVTISLNTEVNKLEKIIPVDKKTGKQTLMNNVRAYHGNIKKKMNLIFKPSNPQNKVLIHIIEGSISINGKLLNSKDTYGIHKISNLNLEMLKPTKILLFEVLNKK